MLIGLHDSDRTGFPNLALMKISAWHKARGDIVEWWNPMLTFDRVYSSKIFTFTPENPYLPILAELTRTLAFLPQEHNVKSIIADIISAVILFFTFPPP